MEWGILWKYSHHLLSGLTVTLWLSAVSIVGATIVGVLVGSLATSSNFFVQRLTSLYTEALRNIPAVVKLFLLYFVVGTDAITASIGALVLHQSAYISDVTSAGLRSVPHGQLEAARSCGHSNIQAFRYVLLPQAIGIVIPPLTNQYIEILKNSAILSMIAVEDLTFQTQMIEIESFRGFEAATATTVIYLIIAVSIAAAMSWLQRVMTKP